MKKEKISLKAVKNVLSRAEMKKIMAGSGLCSTNYCSANTYCCEDLCCAGGSCYPAGWPGCY